MALRAVLGQLPAFSRTLKWNAGVHNFMTYVTGDIPVGAYSPARLANLGIGHAALDAGEHLLLVEEPGGQRLRRPLPAASLCRSQ